MANLADEIETYLLGQLAAGVELTVDIKRAHVARVFRCAPSQVTYVLATRFTPERGFSVESRRGGGGFVRITRIESRSRVLREILRRSGHGLDQGQAEHLIGWLRREALISHREALLLSAAIELETIALPERDQLRGRLLKSMMVALMTADRAAELRPNHPGEREGAGG